MRLTKCSRAVGFLLTGGVLLQFGGCLGSIWPQIGIGFGRTIGGIPGAALGESAFTAIGIGESGGNVNNAGAGG